MQRNVLCLLSSGKIIEATSHYRLTNQTDFHHGLLGLLGESYQDLAGKEDVILAHGRALVDKHHIAGVMLTGGFVTLFNPGIEAKLAATIGLPVVSAFHPLSPR